MIWKFNNYNKFFETLTKIFFYLDFPYFIKKGCY